MTTTKAVWTNPETNEYEYDWQAIQEAAMRHAIYPDELKDFAFDAATEPCSTEELVAAFFEWLDAEKQAVNEAIPGLQQDWFAAHSECEFPTADRTDEIINKAIEGIRHPGDDLTSAVNSAMDEWYAEVRQQGYYRITCTAHYTPVATGPYATEEEAETFAAASLLDAGVNNPPPFRVEYYDTAADAEADAAVLASEYAAVKGGSGI